jgi:hypothetical protein
MGDFFWRSRKLITKNADLATKLCVIFQGRLHSRFAGFTWVSHQKLESLPVGKIGATKALRLQEDRHTTKPIIKALCLRGKVILHHSGMIATVFQEWKTFPLCCGKIIPLVQFVTT